MPRFVTERDFLFFQQINREIVVDVIDVEVILYKIIQDIANVNIYGESVSKARYRGISLNALIKYPKTQPASEGVGYDAAQPGVEFRFVRKLLQDVDVYPEVGDIIFWDNEYYELDNVDANQYFVGKNPETWPNGSEHGYSVSVLCDAHATRQAPQNIVNMRRGGDNKSFPFKG